MTRLDAVAELIDLRDCTTDVDHVKALTVAIDVLSAQRETLTIRRAAERLQVSKRSIYNWMRHGRVEFTRSASGTVRIFADSLTTQRQGVRERTAALGN